MLTKHGFTLQKGSNAEKMKKLYKKVLKSKGFIASIFLLPSVAGLLTFFLIPFTDTVRRSFYNATGTKFLSLENYSSVISNKAFQLAFKNTAQFIGICIPLLLAVSLILALLLRSIRPKGGYFKTAFLLPMAIPVASMVLLWNVIFHNNGLINSFLLSCGFSSVDFMQTSSAFWVLVATYLWKNCGYDMVLWLAGLDGISSSLYEAARVDGAGGWQCFWKITAPSLLPTAGVVAVLSVLNSFKVFREAYLVAGAYPHDSIYLLQHLFNNWFQTLDLGRLCAAAVLLCIGLLLLIVPINSLKALH